MAATQQIRETVDYSTGEVTHSERIINRKVASTPFTMLVHPISVLLFEVKHVKDLHVLLAVCEQAEFNTNRVALTGSRRLEIMGLARVTSSQLSACLTRLKRAGLLTGGRGEAVVNPDVLWRGHTAARAKRVKTDAPLKAESHFDTPE